MISPIQLHVLRTNPSGQLLPGTDNYYTWAPAPSSLAPEEAESATAVRGGEQFIVRPPGFFQGDDALSVNAWNGPNWGHEVQFVAVLEFEGGARLRSEVVNMEIAT
jgi:hypothetical protein